jgi:hypothetical protein
MEEIGIAGGWEKPRLKAAREAREQEMAETTDEEDGEFGGMEKKGQDGDDDDEKETQIMLNVEGDELKWFEAKLRKILNL